MSDKKTDYTAEGLDRLLSTLKGDDGIDGLIASFVDRCQELEDAAHPILVQRNIDEATGIALDRIGALVGITRGGMDDDLYRLQIRGEIVVLTSEGTAYDLISLAQLLTGLVTPDVQLDEYFPKEVYLRVRNVKVSASDAALILRQLQRAVSAGTRVYYIFSTGEASDDNIFHFSATGEPDVSYGFNSGKLCGVA